jgi:hypothetical protein
MATFLEIVQKVSRESGTVSSVPSTVVSQTGRVLKVVNWVNDAWAEIQNDRANWRWMRKEFSNALSENTFKYTPASFNLTDFSRWVEDDSSVTIYDATIGVSDEGILRPLTWEEWRIKYGRGTQNANKPTEYCITEANELAVGPKPDAATTGYTVRGEYYTGNQDLALDATVPNMPVRFHDCIAWLALLKLYGADEAQDQYARIEPRYSVMRMALERDQLPRLTISASSTLA